MRTRKRRIYNRDNKKTKKLLCKPIRSVKAKYKRKSRKKGNKKIKKTKRRRNKSKVKSSGGGFLDDPFDAYAIQVTDDRDRDRDDGDAGWHFVPEDPSEEEENHAKLKLMLEKFFDNDLRTGIIEWKKKAREDRVKREEKEPGWVKVTGHVNDEDNYIKYLLEVIPENIKTEERSGWYRADKHGLKNEAKALLNRELSNESGKNYWIDPRVFGPRWLGLFEKTSADDKIIEMEMPRI